MIHHKNIVSFRINSKTYFSKFPLLFCDDTVMIPGKNLSVFPGEDIKLEYHGKTYFGTVSIPFGGTRIKLKL